MALSQEELNKMDAIAGLSNADIAEMDKITGLGEPKRLDLTPSNLIFNGLAGVSAALEAPTGAIKNKQSLADAYKTSYNRIQNSLEEDRKQHPLIDKANRFIVDTAVYSKIPYLRTGAGANLATKSAVGLGNAAIQGGIPGLLEGAKEGNALEGAGVGTAVAGGVNAVAPRGLKFINEATRKALENPKVQEGISNTLEFLTSVPSKFNKLALEAELAGKSILKGDFNPDTAYRPIEQQLREAKNTLIAQNRPSETIRPIEQKFNQALEMLPSEESFAREYKKLGDKALTGLGNIEQEAGQKIQDVLGNISQADATEINSLRNALQSNINNASLGGNYNPIIDKAGKDISKVYDVLGVKSEADKQKAIVNYLSGERFNPVSGVGGALDKEKEDIAFSVLAQATGKDKKWLKSQLNAAMPKMSTQKRQEFIQELLDGTADKIGNLDPAWMQHFPELNAYNTTGAGAKGEEIARNMFDRIMGKNYTSSLATPEELMINEANKRYDLLLNNLAQNPTRQGYNQAFNELGSIINNMDDNLAQMYAEKFGKNIVAIENIKNPLVKPIDLHNLKETLYDTANYETAGGIRNNALKGMANDINQYLRNKFPEYQKPNDVYSLIQDVKRGLNNESTLAGKIKELGTEKSILSGLDDKLKNLNAILPQENQFYFKAKDLAKAQNKINNIKSNVSKFAKSPRSLAKTADAKTLSALKELEETTGINFMDDVEAWQFEQDKINDILKTLGNSYEKNPRLLGNRSDLKFEEALAELQGRTDINFMDDLDAIRAREALEKWFPGQGGGSGSEQGFMNNIVRSTIQSVPKGFAAALLGNTVGGPLGAMSGLLSVSPKFAGQGTIKNLGRLYNADLSKYLSPEVLRVLNPVLTQGAVVSGLEK